MTVPSPHTSLYTPAQIIPAGTPIHPQPDGKHIPKLFQPLKIRGVEFKNRIWLSPLCQYSSGSTDGKLTMWHYVHLGGIISRGPGLAFVEATAVLPEGRITPWDVGLWTDSQIDSHRTIVEFSHSQRQKIGIQLAHAGRKASTLAPWMQTQEALLGALASEDVGGWPGRLVGPSAIPYRAMPAPNELTADGIQDVVKAFQESVERAVKAGYDVIELHGAHGFLMHEFLSPVTNKRKDNYGGSFENRIRFVLEVVNAVRAVMPVDMPLFFRISGTDWLEEFLPNEPSWRSEDTVKLAGILADHGVDLIDISSGGNHEKQQIKLGPLYQVPLAEAVKRVHGDRILVSAVGGITSGAVAQGILDKGQADVIFVGRQFQRNPGTVWAFAEELGVDVLMPLQIEWPHVGRNGALARRRPN